MGTKIVGVVEKNKGAYWEQLNSGLRWAARQRGFEVEITAPEYEEVDSQRALMQDHLDRGVDVLVFVATHPEAFADLVEQSLERGIPALTMDLDGYQDRRLFHVGTSPFTELGRQAANLLLARMSAAGPVLAQAGSHAPGAAGKLSGFLERMGEAGREVVVTPPDHERIDRAEEHLRAALAAHDDIAGLHGVYGYHPGLQADVLEDLGRPPGAVPIVGFDMYDETIRGIKSGHVTDSIWIREYSIGAAAGIIADLFATFTWEDALTVVGGDLDKRRNNIRRLPIECFDATNIDRYLRQRGVSV